GAACPLERMNRSRSGQWGFLGSCRRNPPKYSAVTTSAADIELLGCPEPASVVIRRMSSRIDLARARRASRLFAATDDSSSIPGPAVAIACRRLASPAGSHGLTTRELHISRDSAANR